MMGNVTKHMQTVREFAMRRRLATGGPVDTSADWTGTCRVCGNPVKGTRATLRKGCPACNEGDPHV